MVKSKPRLEHLLLRSLMVKSKLLQVLPLLKSRTDRSRHLPPPPPEPLSPKSRMDRFNQETQPPPPSHSPVPETPLRLDWSPSLLPSSLLPSYKMEATVSPE